MAAELQTTEPTEFIAGDTVQWKIPDFDDYLIADSWVLSYAFVKNDMQFTVTCSDNGDGHHLASIAAADSKSYKAGRYQWQAYVTKGAERYKVRSGSLEIIKNYALQTDGFDARSHWRVVLDNVEAVIQGRATKDQSSYTINGRQLSRTPMSDLITLYNKAKYMVAMEERAEAIANGLGQSGTIKLRF